MRREKGIYTKEKNLLFLKNVTEMGKNGNFVIKNRTAIKHKVSEVQFPSLFSGPLPIFEITRGKIPSFASKKIGKEDKSKDGKSNKKGGKNQGTLDNWVKNDPSTKKAGSINNSGPPKLKKQTPEEIAAEMKRIREQNERFKEEMKRKAEEAKKQKLEEKARERERRNEEKVMVRKMLAEHKAKRDDLECDDLKQLPKAVAVQSRIPNSLFGEFVTLLEFFHGFSDILETHDSFPNGITFELLETAIVNKDEPGGALFDILSFMLGAYFDLQNEEDEEIKLDKFQIATTNVNEIDKNILGRDEDIANQIRSATTMARWPMKHQGQSLSELHMNEWSITEILRLHIASAGAHRHDKCNNWLYQQRGGYRLSDDPGLQFRMEDPQILEALTSCTVYELNVEDKIKVLNCLMYQILSFATVRDEIDEKFNELREAKEELRQHQIGENKRQRLVEEAVKAKKREEFMQKKEEKLKAQEKESQQKQNKEDIKGKENEKLVNGEANESKDLKKKDSEHPPEVFMTERQRLAIQTQKDKEEKELQKKEDILKSQAYETERVLSDRISDLTAKCGRTFLGRDRAYRRYWVIDSLPGLYVEHDDDSIGSCLPQPTPYNPNAGPLDETTALIRVKEILDARDKGKSSEEKSSSDKENEDKLGISKNSDVTKTYSKKTNNQTVLKQKVLSSSNGSLEVNGGAEKSESGKEQYADGTIKLEQNYGSEVMRTEFKDEDGSEDLKIMRPWGVCTGDKESCVVHSSILPKTHWSYYSTIEEVDSLIDNLNERGFRESELKDKLLNERDRLSKSLKRMTNVSEHLCVEKSSITKQEDKPKISNGLQNGDISEDLYRGNSITATGNLQLRDQILEMEEKIFIGNLGSLKCRDRVAWAEAIRDGGYDSQCDGLTWGGKSVQDTPFESRLQSETVSRDPSQPPSPSAVNGEIDGKSILSEHLYKKQLKLVRDLASAILQIAQMVDVKYIKSPLGEDEKEKKKRLKEEERRKKEAEIEEIDGASDQSSLKPEILTPLQDWENSLMSSTCCPQLFVHLTTLESSIMWSKSLLNTKCRICRRKTDPEKMLLCDGCDRGHHLYCLKPKLKKIPEDDWYCTECKPKMRIRSPKKKHRKVFEEEEPEEEEEEEEEEDDYDDDQGSEEEYDHEDTENDNEAEDENSEGDDDFNEIDEDSPPRRRKKPKRAFEPPVKAKKNSKNGRQQEFIEKEEKKRNKGITQLLLGQRRSATEANERIKNVTQHEVHSGNDSSGPEEPSGERASGRLREKRKNVSTASLLQLAQDNAELEKGGARSKRRRDVDDELDSMFNPTVLEDLLNQMMKNKDGWPFDRPITKAEAPDYHKIISKPMDLGTVRSGIVRMKYTCNQEVLEDIRQVFANCWAYNRSDAEEYSCGVRLEKYFLKEGKKIGLIDVDEMPSAPIAPEGSTGVSGSLKPPLKKSKRSY